MPFRIVAPRAVPFIDSNRVQQAAWRAGYSTRLAACTAADRSWITVAFLYPPADLPKPAAVPAREHDIERLLTSKRSGPPLASLPWMQQSVDFEPASLEVPCGDLEFQRRRT